MSRMEKVIFFNHAWQPDSGDATVDGERQKGNYPQDDRMVGMGMGKSVRKVHSPDRFLPRHL
jgi:hypothetical protein